MDLSNTNPDDTSHNSPRKGDSLFITFNPPDDEQFTHIIDYKERVDKFIAHHKALLLHHLKGYESYDFYLEQSLNGRLHLHGLLKINDVKIVLHTLRLCAHSETLNGHKICIKECRRIDIQKVKDLNRTSIYIQKDHDLYQTKISDKSQITLEDLIQNPSLQTYEQCILTLPSLEKPRNTRNK